MRSGRHWATRGLQAPPARQRGKTGDRDCVRHLWIFGPCLRVCNDRGVSPVCRHQFQVERSERLCRRARRHPTAALRIGIARYHRSRVARIRPVRNCRGGVSSGLAAQIAHDEVNPSPPAYDSPSVANGWEVIAISLALAWILWPHYGAVLWATVLAIVFAALHRRPITS